MMRFGHQPLEKTAVKKFLIRGLSVSAATALLGILAVTAQAQTPPAAPATAPAVKAAPAAAAAAAKSAPVTAPAAAKAPAKKVAAAPSPCKGLDETACKANTVCTWQTYKSATDKNGKALTPHCHKIAGVAAKKPAAAAVSKPVTTAPAGVTTTTMPAKPKVVPAAPAATAPAAK